MAELQSVIKAREHMLNGAHSAALPSDCRRQLMQTIEGLQQILTERQALIELETTLDQACLDPEARDERALLAQLQRLKVHPSDPQTDLDPFLPFDHMIEGPPTTHRRRLTIQFLSADEERAMQRQIRAAEREENEFALTLPTAEDDEQGLLDQQRCTTLPLPSSSSSS